MQFPMQHATENLERMMHRYTTALTPRETRIVPYSTRNKQQAEKLDDSQTKQQPIARIAVRARPTHRCIALHTPQR
jgi:hypothetical protein